MSPNSKETLRPMLRAAEQELELRLHEVCEDQTVSNESTGELIRLEETLTLAAEAAKQAISLRRRLHQPEPGTDALIEPPSA